MDKKDFIFPGVILGFVIITALGLLFTHQDSPQLIPNEAAATTTASSASTTDASVSSPITGMPTHTAPVPHTPSSYYPYGTVVLALNQPAMFMDGVSIRPLIVTEDSRCPVGVECIQAGTVKISLKVNVSGVSKTETIQIGQSITAGRDTITLHAVSPEHGKDAPPAGNAYRFIFVVSHMQ